MPRGKTLTSFLLLLLLSTRCQSATREAVLRYAPKVGGTYDYELTIHRAHDPLRVSGEMHVLSKQEEGYDIQFSGALGDELLSGLMVISDRHNSSHPGYISLNLPDDPVTPGAKWTGEVPWYFETHYVLDPVEISLPASYELVEMAGGEDGKYAIIEQRNEAEVAVDGLILHVGQVGIRWDHEGKITKVYPGYDAFGKLQVGDVVIGVNGQRAIDASDLVWLAEKQIQRPKGPRSVAFTVVREGREQEILVEKSIDAMAVVKVYHVSTNLRTKFDIDRGILLSAEAIIHQEDLDFRSPTTDRFPVVDDYDGFHKFGYLRGKTTYQTRLGSDEVAWTLSLVEP